MSLNEFKSKFATLLMSLICAFLLIFALALSVSNYAILQDSLRSTQRDLAQARKELREQKSAAAAFEKTLMDHSLTSLRARHFPESTIEFLWNPPAPEGSFIAIFSKGTCGVYGDDELFKLTPLAYGQTSYSVSAEHRDWKQYFDNNTGSWEICGQIWKDFEGGVIASDPASVMIWDMSGGQLL